MSFQPLNKEAAYARQALDLSNAGTGNAAMSQVNIGRPNMGTSEYTSFAGNPQGDISSQHTMQDIDQNATTAAAQRSAAAMKSVDMQGLQMSDADYKAQIGLNNTLANIMEGMPSQGAAVKEFSRPDLFDQRMADVQITRRMNA